MVRIKKRYFVVQLDRQSDIVPAFGKRAFKNKSDFVLSDGELYNALKMLIEQFHGDHGLASVSHGFRVIYCNASTRLILLQARHGPHRLVGSVIPFLTKVKDEHVVPRLIYTGATVRHCYKMMEKHQRLELSLALKELQGDPAFEKHRENLEKKMLALKQLNGAQQKDSEVA